MKTTTPTEDDRKLAAKVACTICDHLNKAEVSLDNIHKVATGLAGALGKLLTGNQTADYEQLFTAAVDDYLYPPSENETAGEDSDD